MAAKKNGAGEKLVRIRLPKERRDQEDVFVGINERTWLIKRGVEVEVPECVAEVLENSRMMADTARRYVDTMAN